MAVVISTVVRSILNEDLEMPTDDVIKKAKTKGVTAPADSIRGVVYKLRSEMRRSEAKPTVAQTSARTTSNAQPSSVNESPVLALPSSVLDISEVFANIDRVNKVVDAAGGVDQARQVADAVKSCGSVEAFLKHLDLVSGIRS